jgi:hypothetical protein
MDAEARFARRGSLTHLGSLKHLRPRQTWQAPPFDMRPAWDTFEAETREALKQHEAEESDAPPPSGGGADRLPDPQSGFIFIYALTHPETNAVSYIGRTNQPHVRWRRHCRTEDRGRALGRWIIALRDQNQKPQMRVLEMVPESEWQEAERRWVAHYRSQDAPLMNGTDGGNGSRHGLQFSPTHCKRISEGRRGIAYTPQALENLRQAAKERAQRYRASGQKRTMSAEQRAELSERTKRQMLAAYPLTIAGVTKTRAQWARENGIQPATIKSRLERGWDPVAAVTTPARIGCPLGRPVSAETRAKIGQSNRGKKHAKGWNHSEEAREKMRARSLAHSGRLWEGFQRPDGSPIEAFPNLHAFCAEHGLLVSSMHAVYHGRCRQHRGWTCRR